MRLFHQGSVKAGLTTTRIEAFSDGVFAIAITLLVLEIAVPELTHDEVAHEQLIQRILELWPKFLSFFISFGIISIFWVGHAIMFHFIKRADRMLLWLNSLLLLFISFIPFPAALIGEYAPDRTSVMLYGATLCAAGIVFSLLWQHASRRQRLIDKHTPEHIVHLAHKVVLLAPIVYAAAVGIAFFNPVVSIIIYILVPLAYVIPSPIDKIVDAASQEL